ncbi:MAG: DNA polymerase III subunit delta [Bacteroidales bacterium]|nr:DNA polymerase III subunit delta [Bacteroidales bacterium]MCR5714474.1 DNA polymerase III subunit delta [Bacteroidales bacterium]
MQFKDVIGHETLKSRLIASVRSGRIPHAQLFAGPEEAGTLPLALAYAQYLQCQNRTETDSCGRCPACLQMAGYMHPEVHFVFPVIKERSDKAAVSDDRLSVWREALLANPYMTYNDWMDRIKDGTKQGGIFVEESAALLRKLAFAASEKSYKIVILWMADRMGQATSNKLLKLLEEPSEKTVFLLTTPSPQDLLPTVLSRMQTVRVPLEKGRHRAGAGEKTCFDSFVTMMRTAYMAFSGNPVKNEMQHLFDWAAGMAQLSRDEQKTYLMYALRMIRESYLITMGMASMTDLSPEEQAFVARFAPFVNSRNVEDIAGLLNTACAHIEMNGNQSLVFFDTGLQLAVCLHR